MDINKIKQRHKALTAVLILFLLVLTIFFIVLTFNAIKQNNYIGKDIEKKNIISVSAEAEIYAKPDLALISFSVVTEAKTLAEAMAQNSQKMNEVVSFIKKEGVDEKDLKTTNFNIYPRYEYRNIQPQIYPYPPGKRVLVGYEIRQSLEVKIRDLDKTGKIIEGTTEAGVNEAESLRFIVDNQEELKSQAREEAINKAKEKAKKLAKQLGVKLVRIVSFSENASSPQIFYGLEKSRASVPMGIGGAAPEIEPGENKISVNVQIGYEID